MVGTNLGKAFFSFSLDCEAFTIGYLCDIAFIKK